MTNEEQDNEDNKQEGGVGWVLWTMSKYQMTTKTQKIMMIKYWGVVIDVDDLHHTLKNYHWKSAIM
jgi:hypothetical protein